MELVVGSIFIQAFNHSNNQAIKQCKLRCKNTNFLGHNRQIHTEYFNLTFGEHKSIHRPGMNPFVLYSP